MATPRLRRATIRLRQGSAPHGAGALDVVRMLLRFGRIPAERYELRKPPVAGAAA